MALKCAFTVLWTETVVKSEQREADAFFEDMMHSFVFWQSRPMGYMNLPLPTKHVIEIQVASYVIRSDADMHGQWERRINYQHRAAQ